ncbi:MAG: MHYT domain-containing protein [Candidatus Bathyarchaeia archaeon]
MRAHCTINGYNAWQEVGEDGSPPPQGYDYSLVGISLFVLIIVAVAAVVVFRRAKSRKPA